MWSRRSPPLLRCSLRPFLPPPPGPAAAPPARRGAPPPVVGAAAAVSVSVVAPAPPARNFGGAPPIARKGREATARPPNGVAVAELPRGGGGGGGGPDGAVPAVDEGKLDGEGDDSSASASADEREARRDETADLLSSLLSRVEALESRVNDLSRLAQPTFRAGQYNILASYLGSNTEPWFLYGGLTDSPEDRLRAEEIGRRHRQRDEGGNFVNVGWPSYAEGVLTPEEIAEVERRHAESFAWEVRAPKILDKIRELDADVLSLVELDRYDDFFRPALDEMGYDSLWTKRPRPTSRDGCAVCWRRSKFELLASESFEYSDDLNVDKRDRVALLTLLRMKHSPERDTRLIFVSTHLARNPECPRQEAVRLRQAAQLMTKLKTFADSHGCGEDVPAVAAGDWNAESLGEIRSVTSAVFGLQGSVASDSDGNAGSVPHPLLWGNADVPTRPTSYTLLRRSRIDYLMYSPLRLSLRRVTHLDDGDARDSRTGRELARTIPNERHPSDHLPIAADFGYPTELEVARECAARFCAGLGRVSAVRPLPPSEVRAAFDYFDHDGSGAVTEEELDEGMARLEIGTGDDSVKRRTRLRELCCTERVEGEEGPVATPESFRGAFERNFLDSRARMMADGSSPFMKDVLNAFRYFDLDGNGVLSREEIDQTLRSISPVPISDEAVNRIVEAIDENGDGEVQLEEFVAAMVRGHRGSGGSERGEGDIAREAAKR